MDEMNPTPDVTASAETSAAPAAGVVSTPPAPVDTAPTTSTSPTDAPPSGPARDAHGRFAATPPSAAPTNADASARADAAAVQAQIEEIEALLDGQPTKLRADLKFKIGKTGEELTLKDALKSPLLMRDYTRKTQQVAEQRREFERQQVELQARAELLKSNRERLIQARLQGGEALAREIQHQELLENDPDYRQRFEESEEFRVQQRLDQYEGEVAQQEYATSAAEDARQYIARACEQYPELDPREIEAVYAQALQAGRADLKPSSVDRIIERERQRLLRVTAPVSQELAALKAELAALKAERTVQQHNAATIQQIGNAKAPAVGKPAAGQVPITPGIKPFNPDTDDPAEWKRRWRAAS